MTPPPDSTPRGQQPPDGLRQDFPLARLTTVRTGGAADWFARPAGIEALEGLLAWAADQGLPVGLVGSGSNLLVADEGFRGLAIKLDGELASIERDGSLWTVTRKFRPTKKSTSWVSNPDVSSHAVMP